MRTAYSRRTLCLFEVYPGSPLDPPDVAFEGPLPEFAQFLCDSGSRYDVGRLDCPTTGPAVAHLLALRLARVTHGGDQVEPTEAGRYRQSAVQLRGRQHGECPHCGGAVVWEDESVAACQGEGCRAAWLPMLGKQIRRPGVPLYL